MFDEYTHYFTKPITLCVMLTTVSSSYKQDYMSKGRIRNHFEPSASVNNNLDLISSKVCEYLRYVDTIGMVTR